MSNLNTMTEWFRQLDDLLGEASLAVTLANISIKSIEHPFKSTKKIVNLLPKMILRPNQNAIVKSFINEVSIVKNAGIDSIKNAKILMINFTLKRRTRYGIGLTALKLTI